ncbi:hypothetical protein ACCS75_32765, partial [Rhizobium ruizarguesonis]
GWSSPVARQAHNLKAAGSNPAPATKLSFQKSKRSSWSSPLGGQSIHWIDCLSASPRQAHNLKAAGSNPAPATKFLFKHQHLSSYRWRKSFAFPGDGSSSFAELTIT